MLGDANKDLGKQGPLLCFGCSQEMGSIWCLGNFYPGRESRSKLCSSYLGGGGLVWGFFGFLFCLVLFCFSGAEGPFLCLDVIVDCFQIVPPWPQIDRV